MRSHIFVALVLLAFCCTCFGQSEHGSVSVLEGAASNAPIAQENAVTAALEHNRQIRAAERRLLVARSKISTARSLDDPMFMVRDWGTPLSRPWDLNRAQLMFSVQQTFSSKEKRDLRSKVAGDDVEVAASELEALKQEVAAEVRERFAVLRRNDEEMRLHDRETGLMKEALAAALAEYTTGRVPQADVLRAQMAVTRLQEHLIELDEERDQARAELNVLMDRPADAALDVAGDAVDQTELPALEELELLAIDHRPELAGLRTMIGKSRDEAQAARLAMKPDFTAALGYMLMPTGSFSRNAYMAEMTMNLPWLNRDRHEGEARQADTATGAGEAELEARTSAVFLEVRQAQIGILAAERRTKVYRDTLLPQADAAFKAATAAYENNRTQFSMLIDSQNLLLDIQTALYKATSARDAGMAQLERAIGTTLPAKPAADLPAKPAAERTRP